MKMVEVYCCYDDSENICWLGLWNEPNGKYISAVNTIKSGMIGKYFKLMLRLSWGSFYRMMKTSDLTMLHHRKQPHAYLFLLAAFQNGAGSALMTDAHKHYEGQDIYLENSNPTDNDGFYHKFGLCDLPEISWKNGRVKPMLRLTEKANKT